jgi:exopolysaccharide production protein ExoZ
MDPSPPGVLGHAARWFEPGLDGPGRLLPMEGLRGIAVALVFFVHYGSQLGDAFALTLPAAGRALQGLGHIGVDLFFVLSGYLIYGSLLRRHRPYGGFMLRRVQRIYPTFLVVLAMQLLVLLVSASGGGLPRDGWERAQLLAANLLLLPGLFDIRAIVIVAWSLSYEMAFYLSLPVLLALLGARSWPPLARVAALLGAVVLTQVVDWPHPRMGMFGCGMLLVELLALVQDRLRVAGWLDALALVAVPVCVVVLLAGPSWPVHFATLFLGSFVLCAAAFGRDGVVARLLSVTPLRWLGNISYSYYLLHGLVLAVLFVALRPAAPLLHTLGGEAAYWLLLVPAFLLTAAGSAVLYLLVERPFSILPGTRHGQVRPADRKLRQDDVAVIVPHSG